MRRWFLLILVVPLCVIALHKRNQPEVVQQVVLPLNVSLSTVSAELSETTIQEGEGATQAIERTEDCSIQNFRDLGVLVIRGDQQLAYIDGIRALNYFHLTEFVLQPGDIIRWGKVADVKAQALSGVPVAHGWLDTLDATTIFFSWGIPGNESLWRIIVGETEWTQLK
jgi:hypothetical protein